jgi:hypothetical protein
VSDASDDAKLDDLVARFPHLTQDASNCRSDVYPRYDGALSWGVLFVMVCKLADATQADRDWLREKARGEPAWNRRAGEDKP